MWQNYKKIINFVIRFDRLWDLHGIRHIQYFKTK